jgi:hypothetical protein
MAHGASLKGRLISEFKLFWLISLYLWIFFGAFTIYRRLIVAEVGGAYLHYGIALVQALVIAKVVLVGKAFGFTKRFDHRPLIVPVLFKSSLFGLFVLLFGVLERVVESLFRGQGIGGAVLEIRALGANEVGARVLMLVVAFVPFFAFSELGRAIGPDKLAAMFFSKRNSDSDSRPPTS